MTLTTARQAPIALLAGLALLAAACSGDGASVAFAEPADGATVHGAVQLAMTSDGITIEEAGEARDGAGHFHVLADQGCLDEGTAIGKDADTVHFGGGQTEGEIYLGPGDHELCLQVGDGAHAALEVTDTVSVTVGVSSQDEWCTVMAELDEAIGPLEVDPDLGGAEFADNQVGFENVARLVAQLTDGIEHVDADARDDVAAAMEFAEDLSDAVTGASDSEAAVGAVSDVFDSVADLDDFPGASWIRDTCGVDVED